MSYIGQQPLNNFVTKQSQTFSPDGSTTAFTLNFSVTSGVDIMLVINNVVQEPGAGKAYTASGTTLTMSEAPGASDSMYCIFLGLALQTVNPGDGSVGTAKLVDSAVTNAKIANSTIDLTTKVTGVLPAANGQTMAPAFSAVVSTDTDLGTSTTLVPFDYEIFDTDGCYDNTAGNYKFTPTVAGKYYIGANMYGFGLDDQDQVFWMLYYNGTQAVYNASWTSTGATNRAIGAFVGAVLDFNGTTDYVQVYINSGQNSFTIDNGNYSTDPNMSASNFFGYKLIGV